MTNMSLDEAKKIMGSDAPDISDKELDRTLHDLEAIASMTIKAIAKGKIAMPDNREEKE